MSFRLAPNVESRRGAETDFSMLDKVVGGQCPDSRENLVPSRPEARETRIRTSDGVHAYGNTSPVFSVTAQAGSESVGASAARERVGFASESARCRKATRAFLFVEATFIRCIEISLVSPIFRHS